MKIDTTTWEYFKLDDLFDIELSEGDIKLNDCQVGNIPLVSAGGENNGVVGHIKEGDGIANEFPSNIITIDMFCHAYYQPVSFFAVSHGRVNILKPKFALNQFIALFICTLINKEAYKYCYGRAVYSSVASKMSIKIPVCPDGVPDWEYMEKLVKSLHYKKIKTRTTNVSKTLNIEEWKEFKLKDLFRLIKGRRLTKEDMEEGCYNFIGAIDSHNGVREKIDCLEEDLFEANCITVNYNGSVGEAFYQEERFWASDDVNVLYAKDWTLNKWIAMFIITIIKQNKYKFDYGRKWTLDKMKESTIILPVTPEGKPDWQYMENFIKSFPYSDRIL